MNSTWPAAATRTWRWSNRSATTLRRTWATWTWDRNRSPPHTSSPPGTCTASSANKAPPSPPGSAHGAGNAAAPTCRTRACARSRSLRSVPAGDSWTPPTSAGFSRPPTVCPRARCAPQATDRPPGRVDPQCPGLDVQRRKGLRPLSLPCAAANDGLIRSATTAGTMHDGEQTGAAMATPTSSATTRQVVFTGVDTIEVTEAALPAVGAEELLMRVVREGICATDLHLLAGHIGDPFPLVPGHEFVGEITEIGAAAARDRGLRVGDRIAVEM